MESQKIKKNNNVVLKLMIIIGCIFFTVITSIIVLFASVKNNYETYGFINIFGKGYVPIQSNSMKGNNRDSFEKGDLLFVEIFSEDDFNELEVGMIVVFYDNNIRNLQSHRIVYIEKNDTGKIESIAVQGDYSADLMGVYDPDNPSKNLLNEELLNRLDVNLLTLGDIKAIVVGKAEGKGNDIENLELLFR